ncbi:hypothetical protein DL766_002389 [Monosporascus sp. MC13-8B]|nr:hypothetical protein DL763_002884 [Monosporascus cannonballus]RYP35656.1 hypothetical protein DL766_002389 [Monosporascus sp. MC13-8B]
MAVFDYPYRKSINITAWVLQIIVCLIYIAMSAFVVAVADDVGQYGSLFAISGGIHIAIAGLTIVLDIVEMILIGRKRMHPALYLTSACIKTLIWTIMFILNLIALSPLAVVFCAVLAGTSIAQLIYGARLVHRKRKGTLRGGGYVPAVNPGAAHMETGYGQQQPVYANYAGNINTAYDTGYGNPPAPGYYYQTSQGTEYKPPTSPAPPQHQYYGQPQAPGSFPENRQEVAARDFGYHVRADLWFGLENRSPPSNKKSMHIAPVKARSDGPRYTAAGELPAPSDHQLPLRVLTAGLPRIVRPRAAGRRYSAKESLHVVIVARDATALESIDGFDERIVLLDPVQETGFSKAGRECDVILDCVRRCGPASPVLARGGKPVQRRRRRLEREVPTSVEKMATWKLLDAQTVPLKDIEQVWNDKELGRSGPVVSVPLTGHVLLSNTSLSIGAIPKALPIPQEIVRCQEIMYAVIPGQNVFAMVSCCQPNPIRVVDVCWEWCQVPSAMADGSATQ